MLWGLRFELLVSLAFITRAFGLRASLTTFVHIRIVELVGIYRTVVSLTTTHTFLVVVLGIHMPLVVLELGTVVELLVAGVLVLTAISILLLLTHLSLILLVSLLLLLLHKVSTGVLVKVKI